MSSFEPTPGPGAVPPVLDDPENLPTGQIAVVLFVALAFFAVGIIWSVMLDRQRRNEAREEAGIAAAPGEIGRPEIGIVDQQLFTVEHRAADLKTEKLSWLHSYGWADKEKKTVHIPIEKAIDQVLAEQKR